jgi:pimeloyl-ACP methyl ester carboxylesterase
VEVADMPEIKLSHGTLQYRDEGTGPTIVLVHGLLVSGSVWDRLIPELAPRARVIVPELPLGSHRKPMDPSADLTPPGLAALIVELIQRLELSDVTLVGNDTGGALSQLVVANHPQRIARLVLVNCDAFEDFPPAAFKPVVKLLGRVPGAVAATATLARLRAGRRAVFALAPLTVEPLPDELVKKWVAPLRVRAIRRDLIKVLRGISPEHTLRAAELLPGFGGSVLIVWGMRDRFFPVADAERLAALFADARLERIENARTFVQVDAPERLAELIVELLPASPERRAASLKGG